MSASDAAPLPRLGEVFFDVRGSSRSMRLSWYADTGVAVFSIWQGGMCTGTFRLAIGDLPRMVETLQRGPGGQPSGQDRAPGQVFGDDPLDPTARVPRLAPLPGEELPGCEPGMPGYGPGSLTDHPAGPAAYQAETAEYRAGAAEYGPGTAEYGPGTAEYGPGTAEYRAERPDHLNGSAPYLTGGSDYPADPVDHRTGMTAEYPAYPSDRWTAPANPERRSESWDPGARPEGSYPGRPGASYPGARAEGSYPGRPGASYPGARAEGSYPGCSDGSYPDARAGGPRSRGGSSPGRHPGGLADDPYLGGTGPMDFPAEPAPPHYAPGTSAPGHDGAPGRSAAEYAAHYSAAVTDDIAQSPPPESFPYGPPPGNRGPAGRHADPEAPFD